MRAAVDLRRPELDQFEKRGVESAEVNGEPGLVLRSDGRIGATYAIDVVDGRIGAVYVMLNPAKLPAA